MMPFFIEGTTMFFTPGPATCRAFSVHLRHGLGPGRRAEAQGRRPAGDGQRQPIPKSRVEFIAKQRAAQGQPDKRSGAQDDPRQPDPQEVVAQEASARASAKAPMCAHNSI